MTTPSATNVQSLTSRDRSAKSDGSAFDRQNFNGCSAKPCRSDGRTHLSTLATWAVPLVATKRCWMDVCIPQLLLFGALVFHIRQRESCFRQLFAQLSSQIGNQFGRVPFSPSKAQTGLEFGKEVREREGRGGQGCTSLPKLWGPPRWMG